VVAASGTTLRTTTDSPAAWARENVWFNAGGSPSSVETSPSYQTALTYGDFAGQRGPDIAFDANPGTGAIFYSYGHLTQVGGTSLSAPLFTGVWARVLEAKGLTDAVGTAGATNLPVFAGPSLYAVYASNPGDFHDVIAGNNRGDDPVGGYIAQRGWDWATGLGSFDVGEFTADMATP
jgi:pseudomonalisin/xanthomonalisin